MVQRRYVHPLQQWIDKNGSPALGWKLYFYQTLTTTPLAVYADEDLITPLDNPVIAEDDGGSDTAGVWPTIFMQDAVYKVILKDADDVTIWTQDPYDPRAEAAPTEATFNFDITIRAGADGGDALETGVVDDYRCSFAFSITRWTIENNGTGSITWDIRKNNYSTSDPPDSGETIVASAAPATSSAQSAQNTTLVDWTTSVSADQQLRFVLTAVDATLTRSTLILRCTRTVTLS